MLTDATWCGPCRSAAPIYAKLSEEFTEQSCCFAKVDVDHARDVSQQLGVTAMPTFKIFKNGAEVDSQRGWPGEAKLRELLVKHGAQLAKKE
jgi:thioredoxin 1